MTDTTRYVNTGGARHLSSDAVADEIEAAQSEGREISDAAAATIAAWYQSPGTVGHVLASLASGLPVEYDALADDIHHTYRDVAGHATENGRELDMLSTWALDRARG